MSSADKQSGEERGNVVEEEEDEGVCGLLFGNEEEETAAAEQLIEFEYPLRASYPVVGESDVESQQEGRSLSLVKPQSKHSLWGHELWNAAKYLSAQMLSGKLDVKGKTVLEVGAGLGIPSIVAAQCGARRVVVTDYPDDALLDVLERNVARNSAGYYRPVGRDGKTLESTQNKEEKEEAEAQEKQKAAADTELCVLPLKWGHAEQTEAVLENVGGCGFDIVILSDVVFNHVCHRDLLSTTARCLMQDKRAVSYVVFSHHRVHKVQDDLSFFGVCEEFGLQHAKTDEVMFPVMFQHDPGPEAVRGPVHCYELRHTMDAAGPPVHTNRFDVVIQGTGLVESILSAALARSGYTVLHLEDVDHYGGCFATFDARSFVRELKGSARFSSVTIDVDPFAETETPNAIADNFRDYLVDVVPLNNMCNGDLVEMLVTSNTARSLEFHNMDRLVLLRQRTTSSGEGGVAVSNVPLNRSDVFKSKLFSPMEMRRLMQFVSDLAKDAQDDEEDDGEEGKGKRAAKALADDSDEQYATLHAYLTGKYKLSQHVVDNLTLYGALVRPEAVAPSEGIAAIRHFTMSVGRFGGTTPFICCQYGICEVPQNLCRISAVWGSVFVLRRSITSVHTDSVVLSNKQRVHCSNVVTCGAFSEEQSTLLRTKPTETAAASDQRTCAALARVVVVCDKPLVSWGMFAAQCGDEPEDADETADRQNFTVPIVAGQMAVAAAAADGKEEEGEEMVQFVQYGSLTNHCPGGDHCVVHFTANAERLPAAKLRQAVADTFAFDAESRSFSISPEEKANVLLFSSFELRPDASIYGSQSVRVSDDLRAAVKELTSTTWQEPSYLSWQCVPHVTEGLDDGAYAWLARHAFDRVVAHTPKPSNRAMVVKATAQMQGEEDEEDEQTQQESQEVQGDEKKADAGPRFMEPLPDQETTLELDDNARLLGVNF